MCIRDRDADQCRADEHVAHAAAAARQADAAEDDHQQNVVCLLYTSDAADERSSVDLGGRRIINKKNITAIYCLHDTTCDKHQTTLLTYQQHAK